MCPTFHCNLTAVWFTLNCLIQSKVEVYTKKTVNELYIYSTVFGAAIQCKQYSEITVESGTHVKSVKITLNIFAVWTNKAVEKEHTIHHSDKKKFLIITATD